MNRAFDLAVFVLFLLPALAWSAQPVLVDQWYSPQWTQTKSDTANGMCTLACKGLQQDELTAGYVDIQGEGIWNNTQTCTNSVACSNTPVGTTWGINASGEFYGRCLCSKYTSGGTRAWTSFEAIYIRAPAGCDNGGSLLLSFIPGTCTEPSGVTPGPNACSSTAGQLAVLNQPNDNAYSEVLCWAGCRYSNPNAFVIAGVSAQATFTGQGQRCGPTDEVATSGTVAPGAGASSPELALESTQAQNRSLLTEIRDLLSGSAPAASAPGGTNTGGDLDRTADATEAIQDSSERAADASEAVAAAVASDDAAIEAEGREIVRRGAASAGAGFDGLFGGLSQVTEDFGDVLEAHTVTLFGAGTCPAPTSLGVIFGAEQFFDWSYICTFATTIGFMLMIAATWYSVNYVAKNT